MLIRFMTIKIWDPHFHIWDVSDKTKSGHDSKQLFAPNDEPVYSWREYEQDCDQAGVAFSHIGGAFVEAVSVCHTQLSGVPFSDACLAETSWVSSQLGQSGKEYVMVSSAPLEDPNIGHILGKLAEDAKVCGIRQILNNKPSWPRNERLGNLLDNRRWKEGYGELEKNKLSFDFQLNPHQFAAAAKLIQKYPGTTAIIDHLGSPTLNDLKENAEQYWDGLRVLAENERTFIKISMLAYIDPEWDQNPLIKETVEKVLEIFGKDRCFFASNFPVEIKKGWNAQRLFGAFVELAEECCSPDELENLFAHNARKAYLMS